MRTTVDLDDTLYRRLKATAALEGKTVRELVTRAIERELDESGADAKGLRALAARPARQPIHHTR